MADLVLQIPDQLAEKLERMAAARGITLEDLVREIVIEMARRPA